MGLIINTLQNSELIAYLSGANNYSFVHFRNGEQTLISKSLRFLEQKLPDFIRIHKTILLNPAYVRKLQWQPHMKAGGAVVLNDGTVLPISRRQWPTVVQLLEASLSDTDKLEQTLLLATEDPRESFL